MLEFKIGSPASPSAMVDRESETEGLVARMLSKKINYNVALVGHRRIGKTSILHKAMDELAGRPDVVVAYFDVRENLAGPQMFLEALEKTIFGAYLAKKRSRLGTVAAGRDWAARVIAKAAEALLARQIQSVELGVSSEGVTTRLVLSGKRPNYGKLFMSVLASASALAEKDRLKFVLMIDEFQDLAALSRYPGLNDVLALFRGAIQNRGPNVSYVISGSRVHLSETVLAGGASPLFAHFHMQPVGDLDRPSSVKLFKKYVRSKKLVDQNGRAVATGAVGRAAASSYDLVGGHPYYLLALADAWDGRTDVRETYERLLTSPLGLLHMYCEYVLAEDLGSAVKGPLSRAILEAVAGTAADPADGSTGGGRAATYSEIATALSCRIETLPRYVRPLVEADLLTDGGGFMIRDRVLRDYLGACAVRKAGA